MKQLLKLTMWLMIATMPLGQYVRANATERPAAICQEETSGNQTAIKKGGIMFSVPEGMTLVRTDDVAEGVKCEHYASSDKQYANNGIGERGDQRERYASGDQAVHVYKAVRVYKKDNGDFIMYEEPEDIRDEKTLDIVKGMDQDLPQKPRPTGPLKISFGHNLSLSSDDGLIFTATFGNGSEFKFKNDISSIYHRISVPLNCFLTPSFSSLEHILYYPQSEIGEYKVENLRNRGSGYDYNVGNGYYLNLIEGNSGNIKKLYVIDPQMGIKPMGANLNYEPFIVPAEVVSTDNGIVKFSNGDYYNLNTKEYHFTPGDGTIYEYFPDVKKYRITYTNGDRYIGTIDGNMPNIISANSLNIPFGDIYKTGTLTKANGKEYAYKNGKSAEEEAAEQAANKAFWAKIEAKYGKTNVDKAISGIYEVGMSFKMLEEITNYNGMFRLSRDGQTAGRTWYKVFNVHTFSSDLIAVSNTTHKITYVNK